jgi:hypothetical protein
MKKTCLLIAISVTLIQGCYTAPPYQSSSHVSVGVGYPGVNIGINYSTYPDLVPIPGYPVYYAPGVNSNYFFYDGLYWVFQSDNWYASSWYNGPWDRVGYYDVPVYVLRVPVRYYRQPPSFFRGWPADAPPRWGDHWGRDWEQRRSGWDRWDRASAPAPAPLPTYQRNYSGDRYPRAVDQQQTIRSDNYRYQPRDPVTQQNQQRQQDLKRQQQDQQRQQDLQRQQQDQQRQQDLQRQQQDQQRQQALQRQQQDQQRQQDLKRQQQDQQRQQDLRRQQQDQQHQQDLQRQQQDQKRQQDLQRQQQDQKRQQQDQPRQRSQPEPKGKDYRAAPQDRAKKDKDAQEAYEWEKKKEEERYPNR